MGQIVIILGVLLFAFAVTRFLSDFSTGANRETASVQTSAPSVHAEEDTQAEKQATSLSAVSQEFDRYESPPADPTAPKTAK